MSKEPKNIKNFSAVLDKSNAGDKLSDEIIKALAIPQADLERLESITITVVTAHLVPRKL